jgi:hypothetical protein
LFATSAEHIFTLFGISRAILVFVRFVTFSEAAFPADLEI